MQATQLVSRRPLRVAAVAAAGAAAPKPAKPPAAAAAAPAASKPFTNTIRFQVPKPVQQRFLSEWRAREAAMEGHPGFQSLNIIEDGEHFTVSCSWASIPDWEAWSLSEAARRSHLPLGIYQYVDKGCFPEDFVFIADYDQPVQAKY